MSYSGFFRNCFFRTRALPRLALLSVISLLLGSVFTGCSSRTPVLQDYEQGLLRSRALIEQYGEIRTPFTEQYTAYLSDRLARSFRRPASFQISVLRTNAPLAYSAGGGHILVSRGLIYRLQSEAELAFVLAHEMSHQYLDHFAHVGSSNDPAAMTKTQHKLEFVADRYGTGIMALSGYDPRPAVTGLVNAYAGLGAESMTHPSIDDRIDEIRKQISSSRWHPPGTVSRRAFRIFRNELRKH